MAMDSTTPPDEHPTLCPFILQCQWNLRKDVCIAGQEGAPMQPSGNVLKGGQPDELSQLDQILWLNLGNLEAGQEVSGVLVPCGPLALGL